jgi:beta-glucosidase-like glycosyl hydrolase
LEAILVRYSAWENFDFSASYLCHLTHDPMATHLHRSPLPSFPLSHNKRGRNGETASEDPLFNGQFGAAFAEGAQRSPDAPEYLKAIVTLKHWGAYSVDYYNNGSVDVHRESFDANVSVFDMADSYAPTFEGAVVGASADATGGDPLMGALGVMCSCA